MADKVLAALTKAAKGLLFPSETDSPFEVFVWEEAANTAAAVRRFAQLPATAKCQALSLDDFFADLLDDEDFQALRTALDQTLTGAKAYKFGKIKVTYYIVGGAADGRLAGLKTTAVET